LFIVVVRLTFDFLEKPQIEIFYFLFKIIHRKKNESAAKFAERENNSRSDGGEKSFQKSNVERAREKFLSLKSFGFAVQIRQNYFDVAAKFPDNLPARAARRRQIIGVGDDADSFKFARAFRNGFENRHALGAHRQTVGSVFDVAAGKNFAAFCE